MFLGRKGCWQGGGKGTRKRQERGGEGGREDEVGGGRWEVGGGR
jgi:hypothetical protein